MKKFWKSRKFLSQNLSKCDFQSGHKKSMCPHLPINFDHFPIKYKVHLIHTHQFLELRFFPYRKKRNLMILILLFQGSKIFKLRFFSKWIKTEFQKLVCVLVVPYIWWENHQKWWAGGGTWIFFGLTGNHILADFGLKTF